MGGKSKSKCDNCRISHRSCQPEERLWDEEGGTQQKCFYCESRNLPCGPGTKSPPRNNTRQLSSPSGKRKSGARDIEEDDLEADKDGAVRINPGLDAVARLKDKMESLDCYEELFKQSTRLLGVLELDWYKSSNEKSSYLQDQSFAMEHLLNALAEVRSLAASLAKNGSPEIAECAYSRAVKIFASPPFNKMTIYGGLLREVALFHMNSGSASCAEKYLKELLELEHLSEYDRNDALHLLTQSISKSTEQISEVYRSSKMGHARPNVQVPFPPLHRLMAAIPPSASNIRPALTSQSYTTQDLAGFLPFHQALLSRDSRVIEMIQACPDQELIHSRDMYGRTVLFLAAAYRIEDAGMCIMERFVGHSEENIEMLMDAKDSFGNTILAIAIRSDCSMDFIRALIKGGADPNPGLGGKGSQTPLCAALSMNRHDIAKMLEELGATDHESQIGSGSTSVWQTTGD